MPKIRTLIVDDSAFMRVLISKILKESNFAEVVGFARNGKDAIYKALTLRPDVIILDILMPKMDGISALKEIMRKRPTPILILSALDRSHVKPVLEAFSSGAVDYLQKPGSDSSYRHSNLEMIKQEILTKVKLASKAQILPQSAFLDDSTLIELIPTIEPPPDIKKRIIVIGASAGGPRMLPILLQQIPPTSPPILIVQHMPAEFTKQFAKSLDNQCNISVSEAVSGEILRMGHAYVAKGGKHLIISPNSKYTIELSDTAPVNFVRPSVDVTLESVAKSYRNKATAIILTGMGSDGREGARQIKQHGGIVVAEDKSTAVLFGMPRAVIEAGLTDIISPIHKIPMELKKRRVL